MLCLLCKFNLHITSVCLAISVTKTLDHNIPETVWKEKIQTQNAADDKPATVESLTEANKHLQAELAQLKSQAKNTSYELAREKRALKEQIEKLTGAANGMTQELADLREIVFNQQ